ncbi:hypothetical protein E1264_03105 [Actinomadura sp. KC216]|uniref:hypothetical protein n=1 Tax=Actinomadura sp. KC216 TaxID=2530370 RepID=UPI001044B927|nr:hypothetical protein [Actinomadura sp. KC216]TDB91002.1 hypothetical protein E1264_03105 [Actinomadura sp. KC216]
MALDTPRRTDRRTIPRAGELATDEKALRPRTVLLALAGDLRDFGVHSRLATDVGDDPQVLRCWNPNRRGKTVQVACLYATGDRLHLRYHPTGDELGDANDIYRPGQAHGHARTIAVALSVPVRR